MEIKALDVIQQKIVLLPLHLYPVQMSMFRCGVSKFLAKIPVLPLSDKEKSCKDGRLCENR